MISVSSNHTMQLAMLRQHLYDASMRLFDKKSTTYTDVPRNGGRPIVYVVRHEKGLLGTIVNDKVHVVGFEDDDLCRRVANTSHARIAYTMCVKGRSCVIEFRDRPDRLKSLACLSYMDRKKFEGLPWTHNLGTVQIESNDSFPFLKGRVNPPDAFLSHFVEDIDFLFMLSSDQNSNAKPDNSFQDIQR